MRRHSEAQQRPPLQFLSIVAARSVAFNISLTLDHLPTPYEPVAACTRSLLAVVKRPTYAPLIEQTKSVISLKTISTAYLESYNWIHFRSLSSLVLNKARKQLINYQSRCISIQYSYFNITQTDQTIPIELS